MFDDYVKKTVDAYNQKPSKYIRKTEYLILYPEINKFSKHLKPNDYILDAGCAFGRDSRMFKDKGFSVIGIDLSKEMLKEAKKRLPDIKFLQMDVRKIDFPDNYFGGVWSNATLLHLTIADIKKALKEFYRVLKPNGVLFVSFKKGQGSKEVLETFSCDSPRFFTYLTKEKLNRLLKELKFKNIESYYVNEQERFGQDKRNLDWLYSFSLK